MGILMRRREVMEILGISDWEMRKLVKAEVIRPIHLEEKRRGRPSGRAFYLRRQIEELATNNGRQERDRA